MSDLHTLFVQAKNEIINRGWYQGATGRGPNGEICLGRAITGHFDNHGSAIDETLVNVAIETVRGIGSMVSIPVWNDSPDTSIEDVINILDKAIIQTAPVETPCLSADQ